MKYSKRTRMVGITISYIMICIIYVLFVIKYLTQPIDTILLIAFGLITGYTWADIMKRIGSEEENDN